MAQHLCLLCIVVALLGAARCTSPVNVTYIPGHWVMTMRNLEMEEWTYTGSSMLFESAMWRHCIMYMFAECTPSRSYELIDTGMVQRANRSLELPFIEASRGSYHYMPEEGGAVWTSV